MIVAGIDEAGYGPTLGPLVVSVSVFRLPDVDVSIDLWAALDAAVCRRPDRRRMPIDDSKKLFQQRQGLQNLEEGVLPFLGVREASIPKTFRDLLGAVVPSSEGRADAYLERYPWYAAADLDLPVDTFSGVLRSRASQLAATLTAANVEFVGLSSYPIEVYEFNRGVESRGNKAEVSFQAIGAFLTRLWKQFAGEDVVVFVDRQGGRKRYAPHLYTLIKPQSISIDQQTDETSVYRLRRRRHETEMRVHFSKGSEESSLPVALASMLAKYLRELHMNLFNAYWRRLKSGLKPTAGYAVDARRFLRDIEPVRRQSPACDEDLVRRR